MVKTLAGLPDRPLARSLRTLELGDDQPHTSTHEIDLEPFERLPVLEKLAIGARLRRPELAPELAARRVTVVVAPFEAAAVRTLFPAGAYPRLRDLAIEMTGSREGGRATPKLEILRVTLIAAHGRPTTSFG